VGRRNERAFLRQWNQDCVDLAQADAWSPLREAILRGDQKTARELRVTAMSRVEEAARKAGDLQAAGPFGQRAIRDRHQRGGRTLTLSVAWEKLKSAGHYVNVCPGSDATGCSTPRGKFAQSIVCELPYPSDDKPGYRPAATAKALDAIFRAGHGYARQRSCSWITNSRQFTDGLFMEMQPAARKS